MVRLNMQKINDNLFSEIFGKLYVQFSSKNYNGYYNIPKELENYVKYVRSFFTDKDIKIHYEEINKKYNVKDNNNKFKDTSCGCSCYKCCQELYVLYKLGCIDLSQELLNQYYKIMKQFDLKNETSTIWFDDEVLQM